MNYHRLTVLVFILLQLFFAGYVLRGEIPYNFEILFLIFLPILGYVLRSYPSWDTFCVIKLIKTFIPAFLVGWRSASYIA
jgi:hypothetical protein